MCWLFWGPNRRETPSSKSGPGGKREWGIRFEELAGFLTENYAYGMVHGNRSSASFKWVRNNWTQFIQTRSNRSYQKSRSIRIRFTLQFQQTIPIQVWSLNRRQLLFVCTVLYVSFDTLNELPPFFAPISCSNSSATAFKPPSSSIIHRVLLLLLLLLYGSPNTVCV